MKKLTFPTKMYQPAKKKGRISGFTLIELMFVIVIVCIIAGFVISRIQSAIMTSNEASAVSAVKLIVQSQQSFRGGLSYGSLEDLVSSGHLDISFKDDDGNPQTVTRNGYNYLMTLTPNGFVISAIPTSTGLTATGKHRIGADISGTIYRDINNLTVHYTSESALRTGTSVPYDSD